YIFKRKTRIKILNKKAFELATVKFPLYVRDEDKEIVSEVMAVTSNLENGQVVETKLEKTDLFTIKKDKNHLEQKFTMPAAREGSIIEYSYTVTSDFYFNIPSWEFQNIDYPCLWSEYQVTIPSLLVYIFNKYGVHPFSIDKADEGHAVYLLTKPADQRNPGMQEETYSINANTVKHRWVMKDVPAFYVENFLSTPKNYIDRVSFQLDKTYDGEIYHEVMPTWRKATEDLLKREDFGAFMYGDENNYWMNEILDPVVKSSTDMLQQAKEIYYYVARNYTCTNHYDRTLSATLRDVYRKRSGTVGDVNLLLTALLRKKGINASPVLLSTREFGYNYPGYPVMDRLNYVVCRVSIDGMVYCLDASHAYLGFGNLPGNCYNGHARIISRTDSASIFFMPDSIKERRFTMVNIINDPHKKGSLTGSVQTQPGQLESYEIRTAIALKGEVKYFEELKTAARNEADITNTWIDSLKDVEQPVKLESEFVLKTGDSTDIIYFNPVLWESYDRNPFAAAVRKYPVEMPYPINNTYVLMMEIPQGFEVDELPKMARVSYNGGEGSFEYLVQKSETLVQLRCTLQLKKANFDPEDYSSLRDFFAFVVKKEGEQIVFKKKKQ
ncbi:MAG: DUF3858 domain-containing protein, partial [Chitinophagaceae bacterium]|nr:DUF3858 domain-containing protein [Chitinophagaceae bacterium]